MFFLFPFLVPRRPSRKTLLFHLGNRKRFPIKCSGANKYYWKALELVVSVATTGEGTAMKNCPIFLTGAFILLFVILFIDFKQYNEK